MGIVPFLFHWCVYVGPKFAKTSFCLTQLFCFLIQFAQTPVRRSSYNREILPMSSQIPLSQARLHRNLVKCLGQFFFLEISFLHFPPTFISLSYFLTSSAVRMTASDASSNFVTVHPPETFSCYSVMYLRSQARKSWLWEFKKVVSRISLVWRIKSSHWIFCYDMSWKAVSDRSISQWLHFMLVKGESEEPYYAMVMLWKQKIKNS